MDDQFDDLVPDEEMVDDKPLYFSMCETDEEKIHLVRQNVERFGRDIEKIAKALQASPEEVQAIMDKYNL